MENTNNETTAQATEKPIEELTEIEILRKLLQTEGKEVKYFKFTASLMLALVIVIAIALLIITPKALKTLDDISQTAIAAQDAITSAEATLDNANNAINELTTMSNEITSLSTEMSDFLTSKTGALDEAMSNLNGIDFDGLNKAIKDLQDAVGPFANFMNRFR